MSIAAIVLGPGRQPERGAERRRRGASGRPTLLGALEAASAAGYDEVIAVTDDEASAAGLPDGATVLLDHSGQGAAGALQAAIDWCQRRGHDVVTVALAPRGPAAGLELEEVAWSALRPDQARVIAVATRGGRRGGLVRLEAGAWALLPLEGDPALLLESRSELVAEVEVAEIDDNAPSGAEDDGLAEESRVPPLFPEPSVAEREAVAALLGREPSGAFRVVRRDGSGLPVVIENAPFLADETPMPTRYWLVGRRECEAVGRLEAAGGVRRAEAAIAPADLAAAHEAYGAARDELVPAGHHGPRPSGGVGGTRVGVKCLHAHLAAYLAGTHDPVGRWVLDELAGEISGAVAAIDCGTNSTRLLIVSPSGATIRREMTITRLGEGVDDRGELAPAAIERTLVALRAYRALMDDEGVVAQRATATSAARDAKNAEEFFERAGEVLGRRPDLIEGVEEGRLSYRGATAGLPSDKGPYLVVDLGGGSTEFVAGGPLGGEPAAAVSLNFGCVRVTERFLTSDPPSAEQIDEARRFVGDELGRALEAAPALGSPPCLVGVAGTVSTLVQLSLGYDHYDGELLHHRVLAASEVDRLAGELLAEPVELRRARPGVEPGRADVIAAGALICSELLSVLGRSELVYSESDILDGIAAELLERVG